MSNIDMQSIAAEVAINRQIEVTHILGKRRFPSFCRARFEVYHKAQKAGFSLSEIGQFFDRDHTTIINGIRRYEQFQKEAQQ